MPRRTASRPISWWAMTPPSMVGMQIPMVFMLAFWMGWNELGSGRSRKAYGDTLSQTILALEDTNIQIVTPSARNDIVPFLIIYIINQ